MEKGVRYEIEPVPVYHTYPVITGGMLTGPEIEAAIRKGDIKIDPYDPTCLNPNSYNLKLYPELYVYSFAAIPDGSVTYDIAISPKYLDCENENPVRPIPFPEEGVILYPGVLYLARTTERTFTDKYIPMINGRSSGGRLGISVHVCAGFGDIGFDGTWTLEITVVHPVKVYPNMEIAQICYFTPVGDIELYKGRYLHQEKTTASRMHLAKEYSHGSNSLRK